MNECVLVCMCVCYYVCVDKAGFLGLPSPHSSLLRNVLINASYWEVYSKGQGLAELNITWREKAGRALEIFERLSYCLEDKNIF